MCFMKYKDLRIIQDKESFLVFRSRTVISLQRLILFIVIIVFAKIIGVHVYLFQKYKTEIKLKNMVLEYGR